MTNILEMRNITKDFPGVRALDDVNFTVKVGEIHCLVGENGAGKSTLMKVLSGVHKSKDYEGSFYFKGELCDFNSVKDSEQLGIAIIHQELALFPELTVYENIFIGHELKKKGVIDWNETIKECSRYLKQVNLNVAPDIKVKELGVGQQQLVEIAKALSKDLKLLILDEPTAALNDEESENLLELLKKLKDDGVTSIMISHKLREVVAIADSITVLRDGKSIVTLSNVDTNVDSDVIIKAMVGREIKDIFPKREGITLGDVIFEVKNINVFDANNRHILKDINIQVRKGEVVGIAGLMGAGRTELAKTIFGNPLGYKVSGNLILEGNDMSFKNPKQVIDKGIAYVTEDRKKDGLILINDIKQNITLSNLAALSKSWILNDNEEVMVANEYLKNINIKAPSIEQLVQNLSGGNQQKVSISKWLNTVPKVLILDEPTRGIDVGAKQEIYTIINQLVKEGMSIILISSELPEVMGMSDKIYVMNEGSIQGELSGSDVTPERIIALATQ